MSVSITTTTNVGTLRFVGDPTVPQPFLWANQMHDYDSMVIMTNFWPGNTEWTSGYDWVLTADGCQKWNTPNNDYYDLSCYHSGLGEYTICAGERTGPTGTLKLGRMSLGSNTFSGNKTGAFGDSNTVSGDNCFAFGSTNTVSGSSSFAAGSGCTASGTGSNIAIGGGSKATSGYNNLALLGGKVTTYSSTNSGGSCAMGPLSEVTGSTNSYIIGGTSTVKIDRCTTCTVINCADTVTMTSSDKCTAINGNRVSLIGRTGCVTITDGNTYTASAIGPGGDHMMQCRFNGGGVNGNACYWLSTDVNSNGVKLSYASNSWSPIGSDSRLKTTVSEVDYNSILPCFEKVSVFRYKYKHDAETVPLRTGFYADHFNSAFEGYVERQTNKQHPYHQEHPEDERPIETYDYSDLSQINFAGIRALFSLVKDLKAQVDEQQKLIENLRMFPH